MLRIAMGAVFMGLGCLYTIFAWPMLVWDRPARALAAVTIVLLPVVAAVRHNMGRASRLARVVAGFVSAFLILVLLVVATVTLMRAGFITLKGDRVPLMVELTGETRTQTVSWSPPNQPPRQEQVTARRLVVWLPDGSRAADAWVYGDRVAVGGRAVLFSKRLNAVGVPNLYEFLEIHNGAGSSGANKQPASFSMPFPHSGHLAVHPWWHTLEARILNDWQRATENSPLWALQIVYNQSPYYPLVDKDGEPVKRRFLLDLTLDGTPTSRGSSPLESK